MDEEIQCISMNKSQEVLSRDEEFYDLIMDLSMRHKDTSAGAPAWLQELLQRQTPLNHLAPSTWSRNVRRRSSLRLKPLTGLTWSDTPPGDSTPGPHSV
ncbi:hypothetical protein PAAG_12489 [Paracoccidioides lutzii Pb01]|uniref:Uncharacterized protein n=1 Tax=Paracoccidioides lutzii (strain ATCC MYA-826 / Pb01) TaxID=502779 RepID=A0A0A2VIS5_PARBA|nr:hypothetical protein PAAG_12489 [Paracoccidioides lutzii Pb01]KGQ00824.1 hypothetical protein PAAG_12489 [Paracoccidioides lutzii Pb01]